ncbi:MAG: hypothetical protein MN733_33770 [Nitrososphaera sp.]|nr:hypothetical protein [Nitrososphaera sp.]
MSNDLQINDFVKRIAARTQHLASAARSGGGRALPNHISIRQNRFWLVGEDGPSPAPDPLCLHFVVVAIKKPKTRFFYNGAYDDEGFGAPPTCMSYDGVTPEASSTERQADCCASNVCPKSEWGSAKGKGGADRSACKVYKQLVVKVPGVPGAWLFSIPPASIAKQWDIYADQIEQAAKEEQAKHGFAALTLSTCVTEMTFDSKFQGVLNFRPKGYIGNEKLMSVEDCVELEALVGDEALNARLLWGPDGLNREKQYLESAGKTAPRYAAPAISIAPPKATLQEVVPEPDWEDTAYDEPPAMAKPAPHTRTKPPASSTGTAVASILAEMGLDLDE